MVVTVSASDAIHAFRVVIGDEPLFTTIKADRRSRIQETAISAEAMLPGGPYDLWREDEQARRVKDLADQIPEIAKVAVGNDLKFNVRVELGGNDPPSGDAVDEINKLLAEVSDAMKLQ